MKKWSEHFEGMLNVFDNGIVDVECFSQGGMQSEIVIW